MKSTISILLFLIFTFTFIYAQSDSKSGVKLVWADEFEGTGIPDIDNWDRPEYNRRNNPDGPDGWWSKDDSYLDGNGNLVIRVRKIPNKNTDADPYDYSVGAVRTKGKFEHKYGKYEMRAKLPTQPGWWVAFWMMQGNVGSTSNEGVDGSEVDIMEGWGWTSKINHAIHWDGYDDAHKSTGTKVEVDGLLEGYHIYTLEWYPEKYVFFIDGKETWRTEGGGVCNRPGYIKITGEISTESWAVGTNWSNNPVDAIYPDSFIIDYVRVYDFPEDREAYHGEPSLIPGKIEAEDYDLGESGEVYFDKTLDNSGNIYRVGDVDVQECIEGGYNLGWTQDGEWLEYTVNVKGTGPYDIDIRSASQTAGGAIQVEMNGENVSDVVELPISNSWDVYQTTTLQNTVLEAGEQIMRLNIVKGNVNLNYLEFRQPNIIFNLTGLKKNTSYEIGLPIHIGIEASSSQGEITSIALFLENDSIGGAADSAFSMIYTPDEMEAGWNTITVKISDYQGNIYTHPINIYFGNFPPTLEITELQKDTLTTGENNTIRVSVSDPDGSVDSIHVVLNNYSFIYRDFSGILEFDTDTLSQGPYIFIVQAFDNSGNVSIDTLKFIMTLPPNILPTVEIAFPKDKEVIYLGGGNLVKLNVNDEDGYIDSIELLIDSELFAAREMDSFTYDIDELTKGAHEIIAHVTDDRGGQAYDTISLIVTDSLLTIGDWTMYLQNGAMAEFSVDHDTLKVCTERTTGHSSDVQLIKYIDYIILKSSNDFSLSFTACASKSTNLTLAIKDDEFLDDTLLSIEYQLSSQEDTISLKGISESNFDNYISFYLGYRNDVCVTISNFEIYLANSTGISKLDIADFIYPNPVSDLLNLKYETNYKLYAITGRIVLQGMKSKSINVSLLDEGLYILKTEYGFFKVIKDQVK